MNIDKAIKKQKKSLNRFMLLMGFIFIFLPLALFLTNKVNYSYIIYLVIIEILIVFESLKRVDNFYLKFQCNPQNIVIKSGFLKQKYNVLCEKIAFVDVVDSGQTMSIIILTKSRFRNKKIKAINLQFLKRHAYTAEYYYKLKKRNPENDYYYIVIDKGGYKKYRLLDEIYKNCYDVSFSQKSIECIKEYRR